MLQMLSHYTITGQADFNFSLILKIFSKMPIEFFSNQTSYIDSEGQKYAIAFVQRIGPSLIEKVIVPYLNDVFQVKALVQ